VFDRQRQGAEARFAALGSRLGKTGADDGPFGFVKTGADEQRDLMAGGILDRAQVDHAAAARSDLAQLLVTQRGVPSRSGNQVRIRCQHTVHVFQDFTAPRTECGGQGDGRGITPAPTERGYLPIETDALEAGNDNHVTVGERLADTIAPDVDDARVCMTGIGDDPALRAGVGNSGTAFRRQRHREQRHGDALADRKQHVELTPRRLRIGLTRLASQLVGGPAHGADHHHKLVSGVPCSANVPGDRADAVDGGDRRTAVLADQNSRSVCRVRCRQGISFLPGVFLAQRGVSAAGATKNIGPVGGGQEKTL